MSRNTTYLKYLIVVFGKLEPPAGGCGGSGIPEHLKLDLTFGVNPIINLMNKSTIATLFAIPLPISRNPFAIDYLIVARFGHTRTICPLN